MLSLRLMLMLLMLSLPTLMPMPLLYTTHLPTGPESLLLDSPALSLVSGERGLLMPRLRLMLMLLMLSLPTLMPMPLLSTTHLPTGPESLLLDSLALSLVPGERGLLMPRLMLTMVDMDTLWDTGDTDTGDFMDMVVDTMVDTGERGLLMP